MKRDLSKPLSATFGDPAMKAARKAKRSAMQELRGKKKGVRKATKYIKEIHRQNKMKKDGSFKMSEKGFQRSLKKQKRLGKNL
jgi:hypothetical protein